jgi:hypothetical protein
MKHAWEMNESELLEVMSEITKDAVTLKKKQEEFMSNPKLKNEMEQIVADVASSTFKLLSEAAKGNNSCDEASKKMNEIFSGIPDKYMAILRKSNLYTEEELERCRLMLEVGIMTNIKK